MKVELLWPVQTNAVFYLFEALLLNKPGTVTTSFEYQYTIQLFQVSSFGE